MVIATDENLRGGLIRHDIGVVQFQRLENPLPIKRRRFLPRDLLGNQTG